MTDERPLFQHPPWMVGIMLILGVMSLLVGLTVDPFWLVIGSPTILTLVVYIGVRVALFVRFRRPSTYLTSPYQARASWSRHGSA